MSDTITVVIPTIPPRKMLLHRANHSVLAQTRPADAVNICIDNHHAGAARTRQRGLEGVRTDWVAFLDDDDEFLPDHLDHLLSHALAERADYVYSWFQVIGGRDPFPPSHFTDPFDPKKPIQTTITTLVRTELAQSVGFLQPPEGLLVDGMTWGEDWQFTVECLRAGAKISHLVERTWLWHHDSGNTSGRPDRW